MIRAFSVATLALAATFAVGAASSTSAGADDRCYPIQVCEEVCSPLQLTPVDPGQLAIAIRPGLLRPQRCETSCTVEEYCPPEDPTDGGDGPDYSEGEFAECLAMPLLVDQVRCIQMLLAE